MRELTMNELDQVSGGDIGDAATLWGAVVGLGTVAYGSSWATVGALAAIGMSPLVAFAMVGLAFAGGYQLLQD